MQPPRNRDSFKISCSKALNTNRSRISLTFLNTNRGSCTVDALEAGVRYTLELFNEMMEMTYINSEANTGVAWRVLSYRQNSAVICAITCEQASLTLVAASVLRSTD